VLACGLLCAATASPVTAGPAAGNPLIGSPVTGSTSTPTPESGLRAAAGLPGRGPQPAIEPRVCSTCSPPLIYRGGPVLSTTTAAGLTVTPIFWQPLGRRYVFPRKYESIIDTYIENVAAASGSTTNVYSVDTEYYAVAGGVPTFIKYDIQAGGPVVDTDPFPPSGCTPAPGYTACITDAELQSELKLITDNLKLPTDLAHFYPVFFPPGVETVNIDGSNSFDGFCGYHRAFGPNADKTVYADLPYEAHDCNAGQAPNGDLQADGEVNTLSHELNDAITDPLELDHAWIDMAGNEAADMCDQVYGRPLGSTNRSNPSGSEYNQVINGSPYYIQQVFSNLAFEKYGAGKGCAPSEALVDNPDAEGVAQATTVVLAFAHATPTSLPADGKATSKVVVMASDSAGNGVAGDHMYFSTGLRSGTGDCGTLSKSEATTGGNGDATVTYTASGSDVSCWVMAIDADGGQAAESVIYQGTTGKEVPTVRTTFPTLLKAGAAPTLFTVKVANPSPQALANARVDFAVVSADASSPNVDAHEVHLSYSRTGPKGRFTNVALTGSTGRGAIEGHLGPDDGATLPPASSQTLTFRVALAAGVPVSKSAPIMAFAAYIDQFNTASGSRSTVAATSPASVSVPGSAPTNTMRYVLIGAGVLVILLAILLIVLWRRRRRHHRGPTAAATAP
jgi:Phosphate-induced protein 1 conserved region